MGDGMTAASLHTMTAGFTGCIIVVCTTLFKIGAPPDGVTRTMPWRRLEYNKGVDLSDIPEELKRTIQSSEVAYDAD